MPCCHIVNEALSRRTTATTAAPNRIVGMLSFLFAVSAAIFILGIPFSPLSSSSSNVSASCKFNNANEISSISSSAFSFLLSIPSSLVVSPHVLFAEAAAGSTTVVCNGVSYSTGTYTMASFADYLWSGCRFKTWATLNASSLLMPLGGSAGSDSSAAAITVNGGTVAASKSSGIRIVAYPATTSAAAAANYCALQITVANVVFEENTILMLLGTLSPSSTVVFSGNTFTLNALNTNSASTIALYGIGIGVATGLFELMSSATVLIANNTFHGAKASLTSAGVFLRGAKGTIASSASLTVAGNTANFDGCLNAYLLWLEFNDAFTIASSGSLAFADNTFQNFTALRTALMMKVTAKQSFIVSDGGLFTLSENQMIDVGVASRVGFLDLTATTALEMSSGGGMLFESNRISGANNADSTMLLYLCSANGAMRSNASLIVRDNYGEGISGRGSLSMLVLKALSPSAPYEISAGSRILIDNNVMASTTAKSLSMNVLDVSAVSMSGGSSWLNVTNNTVLNCATTSGELSIIRSWDKTSPFTVDGFAVVGNTITQSSASMMYVLILTAASINFISGGGKWLIEENVMDRTTATSACTIAELPDASGSSYFALTPKSLFSFSNNRYTSVQSTVATMQMLNLQCAAFTATNASVVIRNNAIMNTTAKGFSVLNLWRNTVAGLSTTITLTASVLDVGHNSVSSTTASTGAFVLFTNRFDVIRLDSATTYTTDMNTVSTVTAVGLQVVSIIGATLSMASGAILSASTNVVTECTTTGLLYGAWLSLSTSIRLEAQSAIAMSDNDMSAVAMPTASKVGVVAYVHAPGAGEVGGITLVGGSTLSLERNRAATFPSAAGSLRAASIAGSSLAAAGPSSAVLLVANRVVGAVGVAGSERFASQVVMSEGITLGDGAQLTITGNFIDGASPKEAHVVQLVALGVMMIEGASTVTLSDNYASNVALSGTVGHVVSVRCGLLQMAAGSSLVATGNTLANTAITGVIPDWCVVRFALTSGESAMSGASRVVVDTNAFVGVTRSGSSKAALVHFSVVSLRMSSASTIAVTNGSVPLMSAVSPLIAFTTTAAVVPAVRLGGSSSITISANTVYATVEAAFPALVYIDMGPEISDGSSVNIFSNILDTATATADYYYSGIAVTRVVAIRGPSTSTSTGAALNVSANTLRLTSGAQCPPYAVELGTVVGQASTSASAGGGSLLSVESNTVSLATTAGSTAASVAASACPAMYALGVANVSVSSFTANSISANTAARIIHLVAQTVPANGVANYNDNTVTYTGASGIALPAVGALVTVATLTIDGNGSMNLNANTLAAPGAQFVSAPHYVLDSTAFAFAADAAVTACGNRLYGMLREQRHHVFVPPMALRDEVKRTACATLTASLLPPPSPSVTATTVMLTPTIGPKPSPTVTMSPAMIRTPTPTIIPACPPVSLIAVAAVSTSNDNNGNSNTSSWLSSTVPLNTTARAIKGSARGGMVVRFVLTAPELTTIRFRASSFATLSVTDVSAASLPSSSSSSNQTMNESSSVNPYGSFGTCYGGDAVRMNCTTSEVPATETETTTTAMGTSSTSTPSSQPSLFLECVLSATPCYDPSEVEQLLLTLPATALDHQCIILPSASAAEDGDQEALLIYAANITVNLDDVGRATGNISAAAAVSRRLAAASDVLSVGLPAFDIYVLGTILSSPCASSGDRERSRAMLYIIAPLRSVVANWLWSEEDDGDRQQQRRSDGYYGDDGSDANAKGMVLSNIALLVLFVVLHIAASLVSRVVLSAQNLSKTEARIGGGANNSSDSGNSDPTSSNSDKKRSPSLLLSSFATVYFPSFSYVVADLLYTGIAIGGFSLIAANGSSDSLAIGIVGVITAVAIPVAVSATVLRAMRPTFVPYTAQQDGDANDNKYDCSKPRGGMAFHDHDDNHQHQQQQTALRRRSRPWWLSLCSALGLLPKTYVTDAAQRKAFNHHALPFASVGKALCGVLFTMPTIAAAAAILYAGSTTATTTTATAKSAGGSSSFSSSSGVVVRTASACNFRLYSLCALLAVVAVVVAALRPHRQTAVSALHSAGLVLLSAICLVLGLRRDEEERERDDVTAAANATDKKALGPTSPFDTAKVVLVALLIIVVVIRLLIFIVTAAVEHWYWGLSSRRAPPRRHESTTTTLLMDVGRLESSCNKTVNNDDDDDEVLVVCGDDDDDGSNATYSPRQAEEEGEGAAADTDDDDAAADKMHHPNAKDDANNDAIVEEKCDDDDDGTHSAKNSDCPTAPLSSGSGREAAERRDGAGGGVVVADEGCAVLLLGDGDDAVGHGADAARGGDAASAYSSISERGRGDGGNNSNGTATPMMASNRSDTAVPASHLPSDDDDNDDENIAKRAIAAAAAIWGGENDDDATTTAEHDEEEACSSSGSSATRSVVGANNNPLDNLVAGRGASVTVAADSPVRRDDDDENEVPVGPLPTILTVAAVNAPTIFAGEGSGESSDAASNASNDDRRLEDGWDAEYGEADHY